MASEGRNLRKRKWKSSPQKSAKMGLDFGQKTPTPKKRKLELTNKQDSDPDSFNIKSFYGKRDKVHFPHSPRRRKAVEKLLERVSDENTESESEILVVKGRRSSQLARRHSQPARRLSQPVHSTTDFDFHSSGSADTDSDGQTRNILKPKNNQGNASAKKVPLNVHVKKTPVNKAPMKKLQSYSTGKISCKPTFPDDDPSKTPINSGKKFFKTRTLGSGDTRFGGVVVRKGFKLQFVPKKLNISDSNSSKKEKDANKKKDNIQTKTVPKVSAKSIKSIDPEGVFYVALEENRKVAVKDDGTDCVLSPCQPETDRNEVTTTVEADLKRQSSKVGSHVLSEVSSTVEESVDDVSSTVVENVNEKEQQNQEKTDSAIDTAYSEDLITSSNDEKSLKESTTEVDGSEDLFSTSGRSTPLSLSTPSASGSPASSTGSSLQSGPGDGSKSSSENKLFPIFRRGKSSPGTPSSCSSHLSKLRSTKSPKSSPMLRYKPVKDGKEQMGIDAGQKRYGVTQCELCSMVYELANPVDEMMHQQFHQSLLNVLKFPGWKKERVVQEFLDTGCRIIKVLPEDSKYALKKVEDINRIMGEELGFPDPNMAFRQPYMAFLYVSDNKRIEGCCICETIDKAFPVISQPHDSQSSPGDSGQRPWYCSDKPKPASLGISRIWVHTEARRKGVATKMLDCVRERSVYGTVIDKRKMAFSDPTPDGKTLATKYTGSPNFLVYKFT